MIISTRWILAFCVMLVFALGGFLFWRGRVIDRRIEAEKTESREAFQRQETARATAQQVRRAEDVVRRARQQVETLEQELDLAKQRAEQAREEAEQERKQLAERAEGEAAIAEAEEQAKRDQTIRDLKRKHEQHLANVRAARGRRVDLGMLAEEYEFIRDYLRLEKSIATSTSVIAMWEKANNEEKAAEQREELQRSEEELRSLVDGYMSRMGQPRTSGALRTGTAAPPQDGWGRTKEGIAGEADRKVEDLEKRLERVRAGLADAEQNAEEARQKAAQVDRGAIDEAQAEQDVVPARQVTAAQEAVALLFQYSVLKRWKPEDEPHGIGMDVLLEEDPDELNEGRITAFIQRLAGRSGRVHLRVFLSREAYREANAYAHGPEYESGYLLFYVKNTTSTGEYAGCDEIRWMQKTGKFGRLSGKRTLF